MTTAERTLASVFSVEAANMVGDFQSMLRPLLFLSFECAVARPGIVCLGIYLMRVELLNSYTSYFP